jgi:hypothetical protein
MLEFKWSVLLPGDGSNIGARSLPVINQNFLAGLANFRPILLEAGENRHVTFRNHFSAMPLHIGRTRSLFFRGSTLRKNR